MTEEENITDERLLYERPHALSKSRDELLMITGEDRSQYEGVQRIYKLNNGYGLSVVNPPVLRSYPYAWEIAVLKLLDEKGEEFELNYETPLTSDVEVFSTNSEANEFIRKAIEWSSNP